MEAIVSKHAPHATSEHKEENSEANKSNSEDK